MLKWVCLGVPILMYFDFPSLILCITAKYTKAKADAQV